MHGFGRRKKPRVVRDRLATIEFLLFMLFEQEAQMAGSLDRLKESVRKNTDQGKALLELLKGIKAKLADAIASGDPAELDALAQQLDTETQEFVDATLENTPADPNAPPA